MIIDFTKVKVDLSDYYSKEEVDSKISGIDLSDYYTKTESDNKYSTKEELTTLSTKVDGAINDLASI